MKKDQKWQSEPVTPVQAEFMKKLHVRVEPGMTKLDAKKAIDSAILRKRKLNFRNAQRRKAANTRISAGII